MHVFGLFLFPFFGCGFVLYFLPTIVALLRERHDKISIFLLNFFLGWSLIGWTVPDLGVQERSDRLRSKSATLLGQQPRRFFRVVGKNDARAGAPDDSSDSIITRSRSIQPLRAAASIIAYSPDT